MDTPVPFALPSRVDSPAAEATGEPILGQGDEARIPPILYWAPSLSGARAPGGHRRCLPHAIAPTSVCLRGDVAIDRPGVLIPAFTHHHAEDSVAGLLSVAHGLGRALWLARPALLFRRVGVPARPRGRTGGCREVPLAARGRPAAPGTSSPEPGGGTTPDSGERRSFRSHNAGRCGPPIAGGGGRIRTCVASQGGRFTVCWY